MPWYTHLLYYWRIPPSTCLWKVICTHLFLFMIIICSGSFLFMGIFSVYENLFLFMIICGGSFLFMRISSYLWLSVRIFSVYENLFLFMIIYKNLFFLWEPFWISSYLWSSVFLFMINYFITYFLSHLPVCAQSWILITILNFNISQIALLTM